MSLRLSGRVPFDQNCIGNSWWRAKSPKLYSPYQPTDQKGEKRKEQRQGKVQDPEDPTMPKRQTEREFPKF